VRRGERWVGESMGVYEYWWESSRGLLGAVSFEKVLCNSDVVSAGI